MSPVGWPEQPSDPPPVRGRVALGETAWTDEGDGPTVLAVHGLPGSARDFRWLVPALPPCRVVRVNLPGYGGTPAATFDPDAVVQHIVDVADAAGVQRCVVMGHSFGCGLASRAAIALGDRVTGLALLAPAGLHPHNVMKYRRVIGAIGRVGTTPGLRRATGAALLPLYRSAGFKHATADEARQTFAIVGRWDWAATRPAVEALRGRPTLLAWAEDDPIVEPPRFREWAAALGVDAPLAFDTGGHAIQKSRANEIGAAFARLLG